MIEWERVPVEWNENEIEIAALECDGRREEEEQQREKREKAAAKLTLLINKPRTCVGVRTQQVALPHHDTCLEQP